MADRLWSLDSLLLTLPRGRELGIDEANFDGGRLRSLSFVLGPSLMTGSASFENVFPSAPGRGVTAARYAEEQFRAVRLPGVNARA